MAITQKERYRQMMYDPIEKLIPRMAVPSIITMLITSIYNMADTFFVSRINTSASGAVGVIFSLMTFLQACAFTIGMGSGNLISRYLGQNDKKNAELYVSVAFFTELMLGITIAGFGLTNLNSLVMILGSTDTIAPYAKQYAFYILLSAPFFMGSLGINNMLRFQGNAFFSMIGMVTGGIINMILDPILIFGFHMGIAGAGLSTALSQCISFGILVYQCNCNPACIPIKFKNFKPSFSVYKNILHLGLPSLARQGIMSISGIMMNHYAAPFGDAAIAALSIVARISQFMNSAVIGFGQGFQPVCGFNFGAGNYDRVAKAYHFSLRVCTLFLVIVSVICFIFAHPIVTAFRKEDLDVIAIGTFALRAQCITMPLAAQITFANMFSQTTGYGLIATIVASLKFGLCYIPSLIFMTHFFALTGLQLAQPVADILAAVISFVITRKLLKDVLSKKAAADS